MRNALAIAVGAVLVLALLAWMFGGNATRLDRSVMGSEGFGNWLRANDIPTRRGTARSRPLRTELSLAILPLYDIDPDRHAPEPRDDTERMANTSPREADGATLRDMLSAIPTLVLLPKWREGFALTGIAHEQTQIPAPLVEALLARTAAAPARLRPVPNAMLRGRTTGTVAGHDVALFRPHLFDRASLRGTCAELAGLPGGALAIRCAGLSNGPGAIFVSDPDLMTNHGLRLAGNAGFALALVAALREDDRPVLLATEPLRLRDGDEAPRPHKRTAEDLSRFFDWPLSALWAMGAAVLGLAGWRGARRFGPARGPTAPPEASSRRAAITAKARLLRLTGADARMAAEHVQSHLAELAAQSFGPGAGNDPGIARWFAQLDRRDPGLARSLREAADRITHQTPAADLPRLVQNFHALARKAIHAA